MLRKIVLGFLTLPKTRGERVSVHTSCVAAADKAFIPLRFQNADESVTHPVQAGFDALRQLVNDLFWRHILVDAQGWRFVHSK